MAEEEEAEDKWSLRKKNGEVLWTGKNGLAPSIKELSSCLLFLRNLVEEEANEQLTDLSVQICRSCHSKYIPVLLSALSCNFWRNPDNDEIDINLLASLKSGRKTVCGTVFKKGDLAWNCRSCGKDSTCVQCDKCFRNSNHQGHEVFFHRSSGEGGCCDCGDPEAWDPCGNCSSHGPTNAEVSKTAPSSLIRGIKAVLKGVIGLSLSYITCVVRGYENYENNPFIEWCDLFEINLTGMLHDDEIHSYQNVVDCLKKIGFEEEEALSLTVSVDKVGEAVACNTNNLEHIQQTFQNISEANLLFSVIPEEVVKLESSVITILTWIQTIGSEGHSNGIRSAVTELLMEECEKFPICASVLEAEYGEETEDIKRCSLSVAPCNIFLDNNLFPSVIPQLQSDINSNNNKDLSIFWSEAISKFSKPYEKCPHVAFSIFVMASPFLSKPLKNCINSIIIYFQHDNYFKFAYSQIIMYLYPALYTLYIRFVGIQGGNIFSTTVQLFTANSIIECLSSDGYNSRVFDEKYPKTCLTQVFMDVLKTCLAHMGCQGVGAIHDMFLFHPCFKNSVSPRLSYLFRDIDYVLKSPQACARILSGERDNGMFDTLLEINSYLQNLDSFKRRTTTHVEIEDDAWSTAINLMLEVEGVSTDLISHAFYPPPCSNSAWGFDDSNTNINNTYNETKENSSLVEKDILLDGLLLSVQKIISVIELYVVETKGVIKGSKKSTDVSMDVVLSSIINNRGGGGGGNNDIQQGGTSVGNSSPNNLINNFKFSVQDIDTEIYSSNPIMCLSHIIDCNFNYVATYKVSKQNVSVNIPLQRLVSKLFTFACMGGLELSGVIEYLKLCESKSAISSLADYSLRCLSFVAQVNSSMWKKNGYSVANLAFNYGRPIFSKTLRNADLHSIQIAMLAIGNEFVLWMALDRFEVLSFLDTLVYTPTTETPALLAEFLKFLSNLVLYIPSVLVDKKTSNILSNENEGLKMAVAREIVHHVLIGEPSRDEQTQQPILKPATFGKVLRVRSIVGTTKHVSENFVRQICDQYCVSKQISADDEELVGLELSSKGFDLIDLEFGSWSTEDEQKAAEKLSEHRTRIKPKSKTPSNDIVYLPIINKVAIPDGHHEFFKIRSVLNLPLLFTILKKSLVLCLDKSNRNAGMSKYVARIVSRVLQLITLQMHIIDSQTYFSSEVFGENCYGHGLLVSLAKVWTTELVKDDELYQSALGWILNQFYINCPVAKDYLFENGIRFEEKSKDISAEKKSLAQKKAAAQQRALAAMNKQAQHFSTTLDDDDEDDESENKTLENGESKVVELTLEDGALECILCRGKCQEVMGYLCYTQTSNMISNSIKQSDDDPIVKDLRDVYRVTCLKGCSVHSRPSDSSSVSGHLTLGSHFKVKRRVGHWLESINPQGWVSVFILNPNFVPEGSSLSYIPQVTPIINLTFSRFGATRVHVSTCGHMMHFKCWDQFREKTGNLNSSQLNTGSGERVCPFCKSICNTLLPHIPPHMAGLPIDENHFPKTQLENLLNESDKDKFFASLLSNLNGMLKENILSIHSTTLSLQLKRPIQYFFNKILSHNKLQGEIQQSEYDIFNDVEVVKRLKTLHAAWSTTSYTILSNLFSSNILSPTTIETYSKVNESSVKDWKTYRICSQMISNLFNMVGEIEDKLSIREPLLLLILGSPSPILQSLHLDENDLNSEENAACFKFIDKYHATASKSELLKMLSTLPYYTVQHTSKVPNSKRLSLISALVYEMQLCSDSSLWGILSIPLLSQDLHVILMAAISLSTSSQSSSHLCAILSLARFVQCLMEPMATGMYCKSSLLSSSSSGRSSSKLNLNEYKRRKQEKNLNIGKYDCLINPLVSLRNHFKSELGMNGSCSSFTLDGQDLLEYLAESWISFLEYSVSVKDKVNELSGKTSKVESVKLNEEDNTNNESDINSNLYDLLVRIDSILFSLELPSLTELINSVGLLTLSTKWITQYRLSHSFIPKSEFVCNCHKNESGEDGRQSILSMYHGSETSSNRAYSKGQSGHSAFLLDKLINDQDSDAMSVELDLSRQSDEAVMQALLENDFNQDENVIENVVDDEFMDNDDDTNPAMSTDDHLINHDVEEILLQMGINAGNLTDANSPTSLAALLQPYNPLVARSQQAASSLKKKTSWKLIGIDPSYPYIDESSTDLISYRELTLIHSISPFMGTLTGTYLSFGTNGDQLPSPLIDFSYFGLRKCHKIAMTNLPNLYTDIYHMTKFPEGEEKLSIEEPCLCLVCGQVLNAGNKQADDSSLKDLGECALHSRSCGGGSCMFFLVQHLSVLLVHGKHASYSPSLYVDANGEIDKARGQNRPMFLSQKRMKKLLEMYKNHQIPMEITRNRTTKSTYIRLDYY